MNSNVADALIRFQSTGGTAQERLNALKPYQTLKTKQDSLYKQALELTEKLYHIAPAANQLVIAKPYDPKLEWMAGLTAKWNPQVTESGPGTVLAFKIDGADGNDHYGGLKDMDPGAKDGRDGLTLPDGRVLILAGTFDIALKDNNPGILASVLYHESIHFDHLSRPPRDGIGVNRSWGSIAEEERDAYEKQASTAIIFGLTDDQIREIVKHRNDYTAAANKPPLESFGPSPEVERAWGDYYTNRQFDLERTYQELSKAAALENQSALGNSRRETLAMRQAQDAAAAAEAKRYDEAAKRSFTPAPTDRRTAEEGDRCGFGESMINGVFAGYIAPANFDDRRIYGFPTANSLDSFKVSLMFSKVCNDFTYNHAERITPPCNDGLDIINRDSNDPNFIDTIGATLNGKTSACVEFLKTHLTAPATLDKFTNLLKPTADWNKKVNAGEAEYWEEYRRRHTDDGAAAPPKKNAGRRYIPTPGDPCSYYEGIRFCPQGAK